MTATKDTEGDAAILSQLLSQRLTFRLARLHSRITTHASRLLAKTAGITLLEWRIFLLLSMHGPATAADLQRLTQFDKALISRTLRGMIEKQWVVAVPSKTDQRALIVDLTDSGRAKVQQAQPTMHAHQKHLQSALTTTELQNLFVAIDKLHTAIDALGAPQ